MSSVTINISDSDSVLITLTSSTISNYNQPTSIGSFRQPAINLQQ